MDNESSTLSRFPVEVWRLISSNFAFNDLVALTITGNRALAYHVSRSVSTVNVTTSENGFGHPSRYMRRTRLFPNFSSFSLRSKSRLQLFSGPLGFEVLPSKLTSLKLHFLCAPQIFLAHFPRPDQQWPSLETLFLICPDRHKSSFTFELQHLPQTLRHFKLRTYRENAVIELSDFLRLPPNLETLHIEAKFGENDELDQPFAIPWRSLSELYLHTGSWLSLDWHSLPSTIRHLDMFSRYLPPGRLNLDFSSITPNLRYFSVTDLAGQSKCDWDILERFPKSTTHLQVNTSLVVNDRTVEIIERHASSFTVMDSNFWFLDMLRHFTHLESLALMYSTLENDVVLPPNLKEFKVQALKSAVVLPSSLTRLTVIYSYSPAINLPTNLKEIKASLDTNDLQMLHSSIQRLHIVQTKLDAEAIAKILEFQELTHLHISSRFVDLRCIEALPKSLVSVTLNTPSTFEFSSVGSSGRGFADHTSLTHFCYNCLSVETLPTLPPQLTSLEVKSKTPAFAQGSTFASRLPRGLKTLITYTKESNCSIEALKSLPQGLEQFSVMSVGEAAVHLPPQISARQARYNNLYYQDKDILQNCINPADAVFCKARPQLL